MALLAAGCIFIGMASLLLAPVFNAAVRVWAPEMAAAPGLTALAPLEWISRMGLLLTAALLLGGALLWLRLRHSVVTRSSTWGCGYAAPTPRMQYTASSFAEMLVGLFDWALRPRADKPEKLQLFPAKTYFQSEVPDAVLEEGVLPAFRFGARLLAWLRVFQQGSIQTYLLYMFLALIALLLWR